jgi:hypothetical protein
MARNIETAEDMRKALESNDRILCGAVLALYGCQEADEQNTQATRHKNGMGFNGTDAYILSSFAQQIQQRKEEERAGTLPAGYGLLSPKQIAIARRKMPKYANQLLGLMNPARAEEPAEPAPASQPTQEPMAKKYFCCDCGQPANVMAWETSLCNSCFGQRERNDIEINRARNDQAMKAMADQARQEQEQAASRDSTLAGYEQFRLLAAKEEEQAQAEGRPSMLVREGNGLRFMTPKEQYAAGYRLNLSTGRKAQPTLLEPSTLDPFSDIPAAYTAG